MTSIAIHIPISPNLGFYSRLKWIRKSLDILGAPYNRAILHITVSNENDISYQKIHNTCTEFERNKHRYRFYIVEKEKFNQYSYGETAGLRFMNIDNSDITIFCDADILFVDRIDDLISLVNKNEGIYGVLAHNTPFHHLETSYDEWWSKLANKFLKSEIDLNYKHSLHPTIKCPVYYNNGFIIGAKNSWNKIAKFCYNNFRDIYNYLPDNYLGINGSPRFFSMQISFTLALLKFSINTHPISEIYNCANDQRVFNNLDSKKNDIRIIHYLRDNFFNRDLVFSTNEEINSLLKIDEDDNILKLFQDTINKIILNQGYD